MQKLKEEILNLYQDYKIFEKLLKKETESLKSREDIFNKLVTGDNIDADSEKLINFYKDNIIKVGQLHFNAQQLKQFIELYNKHSDDLPKEVLEQYEIFRQKYNTKPIFILDNEKIVATDEDYLELARKEIKTENILASK